MWMRRDFRSIEGRFARDWQEAMDWAGKINSENFAGYRNWTVPTIAQYRTINNSSAARTIYFTVFEDGGAENFWSSNTVGQWVASYTSFKKGYAVSGSKTEPSSGLPFSVRLVRQADVR
jgi:hypothetical protein